MLFNLLFGSIMQNLTVFRASLQKKGETIPVFFSAATIFRNPFRTSRQNAEITR